jgi:Tfp pilus assembly protein PilV
MSLRRPISRDIRGSLLIEVLLSVVILSVGLTLMIRSMTASLRAVQYAAGYTQGLMVSQDRMTEFLRKGSLESGSGGEGFSAEDSAYHYSWTARPWQDAGSTVGPSAQNPLSEVDLNVSWRSGKRENNIALTTLLSAPHP